MPRPPAPSVTPLDGGELSVQVVNEADLTDQQLEDFQATAIDGFIGLAPIYGPKVAITSLAMVSATNALVIRFTSSTSKKMKRKRQLLGSLILNNASLAKYAFFMDKIAFMLFRCFNIRVASCFSLLQADAACAFLPVLLLKVFQGIPGRPSDQQLINLFKAGEEKRTQLNDCIRQAWLARHAGASPTRTFKASKIETVSLDERHLQMASKLYSLAIELRNLKPDVVKNDIDQKEFKVGKSHVDIVSTRFKTRVTQASRQQTLEVQVVDSNGRISGMTARTKKVNGRGVEIIPSKSMQGAVKIHSVKTFGREPPTNAEQVRHCLLAATLKGSVTIFENPFVKAIFFPPLEQVWPRRTAYRLPRSVQSSNPRLMLNRSQAQAIDAILSLEDNRRVVLIHGPPGTGKTTVIAASSESIVRSDPNATVWLVAHSNVAVKNIAEKLATSGFLDFKIVVSKEFHFDWHEHLYLKVEHNLIRTDSLPNDTLAASRLLLGSRVILSTLSNMLNQSMAPIMLVAPVQTMIIDEASQIDVGDYLPVINRFSKTLEKLVFIGDDKQLAPYGHEQIKDLDSIFEKKHLRPDAILLDTQYRMPVPLGGFISTHVYDCKLNTHHTLTSLKTCRFVDVSNSQEENRGHSWVNYKEAHVVIAIARQLTARGLAFRIITPYDPQRSFLENELKKQNLPYEDKCFNVDSFQGNEADYIIVSLVRSANKLGFLQENRRVNVMLTRCKKGMVIVTNRVFVRGVAKDSLVGKLERHMEDQGASPWLEGRHVLYGGGYVF